MAQRMQPASTRLPASSGEAAYSPDPLSSDALYQIDFKGNYVEVRHLKSFELTASASEAIWDEALALCRMHNCKAVLRVGPPPIRQMTAVEVVAAGSRLDIPGLKVAYCWDDYRPDKVNALFATYAMENEVTVRFFCDYEAAIEWLTQE